MDDNVKAITWALSVLNPLFNGTVLDCPDGMISPNFLFPNRTQRGGPEYKHEHVEIP